MNFGLGMQIFGLAIAICAAVAIIVTSSAKQIISHYFLARSVYAKSLLAMQPQDDMDFADVLDKLNEDLRKQKT